MGSAVLTCLVWGGLVCAGVRVFVPKLRASPQADKGVSWCQAGAGSSWQSHVKKHVNADKKDSAPHCIHSLAAAQQSTLALHVQHGCLINAICVMGVQCS